MFGKIQPSYEREAESSDIKTFIGGQMKDIIVFMVLNLLLGGMTITAIVKTEGIIISVAVGFMGVLLVLMINFMICLGKSECSIRGYHDFFFK